MRLPSRPARYESLPAVTALLVAGFLLLGLLGGACRRSPSDPRAIWLQEHAAGIRTLDFDSQDDSDLEPLRAAIGSSRLVFLGEPDHTTGSVLRAKARVVRYLHEQLGFDLLVFEAPLFEMDEAWRQLRQGGSAEAVFKGGGAAPWLRPHQGRPLGAYLEREARSPHPLEIAGLDVESGTPLARDHLLPHLRAFLERARIAPPEGEELATLRGALSRLPAGGELGREARFWDRVLGNLDARTRMLESAAAGRRPGALPSEPDPRIREHQLAENLLWLARERYPNQKIVVWAATLHLLRHPEAIEASSRVAKDLALGSMGSEIEAALGTQSYTLAWTGFEGSSGLAGKDEKAIAPAPAGSVEALFASTRLERAFLDLRHPKSGGEWLGRSFVARVLGHQPYRAPWSREIDGLFYLRELEPLTVDSPGRP